MRLKRYGLPMPPCQVWWSRATTTHPRALLAYLHASTLWKLHTPYRTLLACKRHSAYWR